MYSFLFGAGYVRDGIHSLRECGYRDADTTNITADKRA
jgi:hypothetical protein